MCYNELDSARFPGAQIFYWIIGLAALHKRLGFGIFIHILGKCNQLKATQKNDYSNEMQLTFEGQLEELRVGQGSESESDSLYCL